MGNPSRADCANSPRVLARRALPRAATTPLTWTFQGYTVRSYEWGFVMIESFTAALTDPDVLADVLKKGLMPRNRPSITVKISGTHDWVNSSKKPQRKGDEARIQHE